MNNTVTTGIHEGISNEAYHKGPGVSRSQLWTIATKTPGHFRGEVRKEARHFDVGSAIDLAILEPHKFEEKVLRGPDDRRGNRWKDAEAEATNTGRLLLTAGDFDTALAVRDAVLSSAFLRNIVEAGVTQLTGYWTDPETGILCRCRPDLVADFGGTIMLDLKSTKDASPRGFASSIASYGYHAQEAWYSDGWHACGQAVDGFVLLAVEKEAPYAWAVYEMEPDDVAEGRAAMRFALQLYRQCQETGEWPCYPEEVQPIRLPMWGYKFTSPKRAEG